MKINLRTLLKIKIIVLISTNHRYKILDNREKETHFVKKTNLFLLITIIVLTALLFSGCDGFAPDDNPNKEYDQENTELVELKIFPAKVDMKINQSKTFEIKAYNSDGNLIAIDMAKFEKWVAMYQCIGCGVVWKISPTTNSFQTTFIPYKAGRYTVSARYDGEWVQAVVYAK